MTVGDRGEALELAERRLLGELMRRHIDEVVAAEQLRIARQQMPEATYRRALGFQADSAVLTWDECRLMAELLAPESEWPEHPDRPARA